MGDSVFTIDLKNRTVRPIPSTGLSGLGFKERADLQEWIIQHPEIVGEGLLVVTSEFDGWESKDTKVKDRLDILFLDQQGAPVVAELKRDVATDTIDMQALKYAAYCSTLTVDELVEMYARFHEVEPDVARAAILEHAESLANGELLQVKVRLVARAFSPAVTSVVQWLWDQKVDIGCVEVDARSNGGDTAILTARQLLPLPEIADFLVRRRERAEVEEKLEKSKRMPNAVSLLIEHDALPVGTLLTYDDSKSGWWADNGLNAWLSENPAAREATWTGKSGNAALKWHLDNEEHSPTFLVQEMLNRAGIEYTSIPGPEYWLIDSNTSLTDRARQLWLAGGA
jgi:hypothetical protein